MWNELEWNVERERSKSSSSWIEFSSMRFNNKRISIRRGKMTFNMITEHDCNPIGMCSVVSSFLSSFNFQF